jgi:hypothetical protein
MSSHLLLVKLALDGDPVIQLARSPPAIAVSSSAYIAQVLEQYETGSFSNLLPEQEDDIVLSRTYGHNEEERAVYWRKLHNEELQNLYSSPNIVRVFK